MATAHPRRPAIALVTALAAAIALVACGVLDDADPTPTPLPTATATPTATSTPTPTPTPTPVPLAFEDCYADPSVVVSRQPASLFPGCQLVAYYGHPGVPAMGVMGEGTPEQMLARLDEEVAAFAASNGGRTVIPTLHIIAAVAQPIPGADGTHLSRMSYEELDKWVALAEEHDLLILMDLQMGTSTVEDEIAYYAEYLANPRVHLALDPEWATTYHGVAPGQRIGSMDASEINAAQEILQGIAEENQLPDKVLVIHQFQQQMIRNKETLAAFDRVDLVIHMDGFGPRAPKIGGYNRFIGEDGAPHGGFKLFYDEDIDLMSAADVNALVPQPDVITYQ